MGIPVKLKADSFTYLGDNFVKGDIFNVPHEAFASFLCDQEGDAVRMKEDDLAPEKPGTIRRELKRGSYDTKVMTPEGKNGGAPAKTAKPPAKKGGRSKNTTSK